MIADERTKQLRYSPTLEGYARDISKIGLAIILPAIRVAGHDFTRNFTGQNKTLWVRLGLPTGPVTMRVTPVRHEALDNPSGSYLVSVHIKTIYEADQARFFNYISGLGERP